MKPSDLKLPRKFKEFRKPQLQAMERIERCKKKFLVLSQPTGSGKSLGYVAAAVKDTKAYPDRRWLILTRTKQLQDQLKKDFRRVIHDMRGKGNYKCVLPGHEGKRLDKAPCETRDDGWKCPDKNKCPYYVALRKARKAKIVSTNYHCQLAQEVYSEGLGGFDVVVMDEAHGAGDMICGFLDTTIDIHTAKMIYSYVPIPQNADPQKWKEWCRAISNEVEGRIENKDAVEKWMKDVASECGKVADYIKDDWVVQPDLKSGKVRFTPVWAKDYIHLLIGGASKVVLTSATINRKTIEYLGVKPGEYDFREWKSEFPTNIRPVFYLPSAMLSSRGGQDVQDREMGKAVKQIQNIMKRRDGKGLIHTVSYGRMKSVIDKIGPDERIISHWHGGVGEGVQRLKDGMDGEVLVTPSAEEGVDLPYDQCEWQVVLKVPFPDTREEVTRRRTEDEEDYFLYLVAIRMAQIAGRVVRAKDDFGETFIIDKNWGWVRGKLLEKDLMPKCFWESEERISGVRRRKV